MTHYDRRNAALGPGVFTIADARGNNPHGTAESADAEGKRRNAGRYETVGQLDRALDARARGARMPPLGSAGAPPAGAPNPDGLLGLLVVCGLVAAATYVFATRARSGDDVDEDEVAPLPALPAAPPIPQPIVITTPAPVITNPAPVVIDVVAEPARRRRSRKKVAVAPAVVTVTTPS